jgi:UDP-GlcNAc:undecaprenyl-phosphate GlcNAc-1-phosphate transferase
MREYLLTMFVAAVVTYIATPLVRRLAFRVHAVSEIRDRDVHAIPTPRMGGLGMYLGLLAALLLASQLPLLHGVFTNSTSGMGLLVGASLLVVLGIADDIWNLDAVTKLVGQVMAGGIMAWLGVSLIWIPIGSSIIVLDPVTSILLTVFIVVLSVNAVNFVDGLDGLAAGIVGIGALAFFIYTYLLSVTQGFDRATFPALVSAALVGMTAGFLPHNFFPARLFMGDTGSMLLGLLLASSTITLTGTVNPDAIEGSSTLAIFLPILLPIAVILVPVLDLLLAVIRRVSKGRSPFSPDKQHLHHRLLQRGHSQRRAVFLMYSFTALVSFTVVALAFVPFVWVLAVAIPLALLLGYGALRQSRSTSQPAIPDLPQDQPDAEQVASTPETSAT